MNGGSRPPVTVIVPTHNRPELMAKAVRSVVEQTYDGVIEILVVFDACEPVLPDHPIRTRRVLTACVNKRCRGLAGARNTGILAAAHDLVAFLDDDDEWAPNKLEEQIVAVERHPESVLFGTAMLVDAGSRMHERLLPFDSVSRDALLRNRLAGLHASSFLLRKAALLGSLGLVDEGLPRSYAEDYDLLLRASAIAPVVVINRPLVTIRWQGSSHFLGRWATYAEALQYLLAKHPDFGTTRRGLGRIEGQIGFALAASAQRADGLRWAARSLRHDPLQAKAWLAVAVALRLVTAHRVGLVLRRFGRGL